MKEFTQDHGWHSRDEFAVPGLAGASFKHSKYWDGGLTVLDVRPAEEFTLGHLPGAINVPLDELEHRLGELPREQEIVAYCRGPYCILSFQAVSALRAKGYRARRLEEGLPEWRAAGLTIETLA